MNVCFTSATGNMGKTTIVLNLIVSLLKDFNENQFKVFDCDERLKSLSKIMNTRKQNGLKTIKVSRDLKEIELGLKSINTLNIFDLKGHIGSKEANIIQNCDLVIVVSGNESMEVEKTIFYVNELKQLNIPYKILLNKYDVENGNDFNFLKDNIFKDRLMNNYLKNKKSYKKIGINGEILMDRVISKIFGLKSTGEEFDRIKVEILENLNLI